MALENATKISELEPTNPAGGDSIGAGDDHIRMLKQVLKNESTSPSKPSPYYKTLQEVIDEDDTSKVFEGAMVYIGNRAGALFAVVTLVSLGGGVLNGFDEINLVGRPTLALLLQRPNLISASAVGCALDNIVDDFLPLERLHDLQQSYSLDGKRARCSGTLIPKFGMQIYCFGGGIHKDTAGFLFDANIKGTHNFSIMPNAEFAGSNGASFLKIGTSTSTGYADSVHNIVIHGITAFGFDYGIQLTRARDVTLDSVRIGANKGLTYTDKSAECNVSKCSFIREGTEVGSYGFGSFAVGTNYPEGISIHQTLFYQFEKALDITDLFISDFVGNYFDATNAGSINSNIQWGTGLNTSGVKIIGNWFLGRGIDWGTPGDITARIFRSVMSNNHFNFMKEGTDINFHRNVRDIVCVGNMHDANAIGTNIGYVGETFNEGITVDNATFRFYDSYVQFKGTGAHNRISNIVNNDNLAVPLNNEYAVDVYNVEGYALYRSVAIVGNSWVANDEIYSIDNVVMSSGIVYIDFELAAVSTAGNGFIDVVVYEPGGGTITNTDVTILLEALRTTITPTTTDVRIAIKLHAHRATLGRVVVNVEGSYVGTLTAGMLFDGMVVSQ